MLGFSTYAIAELGTAPPVRVIFPAADRLPANSAGYVRSERLAECSLAAASGAWSRGAKLPFRDYPADLLESPEAYLEPPPYTAFHFIASARNVVNEWGYQTRYRGHWHRRNDDLPPDPTWPVLALGPEGAALARLQEVEASSADIIVGIPLVRAGKPCGRDFFLSVCSDVAHVFEVDPQGRRGPSADAWKQLSQLWQSLKDEGMPATTVAQELERRAAELGARPCRHLLHSLIGQRSDGGLVCVALTGALDRVAETVAGELGVRDAILLDNGGSVGWKACVRGASAPVLLVAGPNHRPRGLLFLDFQLPGFLHPLEHAALG